MFYKGHFTTLSSRVEVTRLKCIWVMLTGAPGALVKDTKKNKIITIKENCF